IVIRLVWVPLATAIPRLLSPAFRRRDPMPPWYTVFIVGWTRLAGNVSLAPALSLPLIAARGEPFPSRNLIIVITFEVILATLVVQGLTLSPLIRRLRLSDNIQLHPEKNHSTQ